MTLTQKNLWVPQQWPPPMVPMFPTPLQQPVSVYTLTMVAETWVADHYQTEKVCIAFALT